MVACSDIAAVGSAVSEASGQHDSRLVWFGITEGTRRKNRKIAGHAKDGQWPWLGI